MSKLPFDQTAVLVVLLILALVTILIDAGLFIAWAFSKDDVDAGRRPPLFSPQWSLVDVWAGGQIVVILLLIIAFFGMFIQVLISGSRAAFGNPQEMIPFLVITLLAQNVLLFGVPAGFIKIKYSVNLEQIGLPIMPTLRQVITGLAYAVGLMILTATLEQVLVFTIKHTVGGQFLKWLEDLTKSLTVEGLLKGKMTWGFFLTMLFGAGIAAPIGEEMFFRGFLYNCAKRRFGITAGAIISAAIFALAHMGPLAVIVIFVMGVLLAMAYEKTGSLWVTIIMHATNNSLAIIGVFVTKQMGWG